jgi:hypothetical protein
MKLESVNSSLFKLGGVTYTKGDYVPVWKNLNYTNDVVDNDKSVPTVNIINKNTNLGIFTDYVSHTRFVDSTGTPYADVATFALQLATIISGNSTSVGPTGPTGPQGPVGPAGLTWKGAWVSGTSYLINDAVGYSGASYFCIANTSGTTTPNLATTAWALLASQGAVGPAGATGATGATGPQGPTGATGPSGSVVAKTRGYINGGPLGSETVLLYDINITDGGGANTLFKLPNNAILGKEIIVDCIGSGVGIYPFSGGGFETAVNGQSGQISIQFNGLVKFTSISNNYWIVETLQRNTPKLEGKDLTLTGGGYYLAAQSFTTAALSLATLNTNYPESFAMNGFQVFCHNIVGGGLVYTKINVGTWVSNPITMVS